MFKKSKAIEVFVNHLAFGILGYFGIYAVVNATSYPELGLATFATAWALINVFDFIVKMIILPASKAIANSTE